MSGGGGGGYSGPVRSQTDCNIVERIPLNSPAPSVVLGLKPGDVLAVEESGGKLLATHHGKTAGSLTPATLLDLLECIAKGKEYVAEVTKRSGGLCEIEIRPK